MWGIRAIRVGLFLGGLLVTTVASGCCSDCCRQVWKIDKAVPTSQPGAPGPGDNKDAEKVLSERKRGAQSYPSYPNEQPAHLTPERIKGGIY